MAKTSIKYSLSVSEGNTSHAFSESSILPKGWIRTTLGDIVCPRRSRVLPQEHPDLPYIGLTHIESQSMRLSGKGNASDVRSSSLFFEKGDVLYGKMRPYLNKVWVANVAGMCSAEFLVFPHTDELNNGFLAFRLNANDFVNFANQQVSGDRPRTDFKGLSSFPIHLPPLAEQGRIVATLNESFARMRASESAAQQSRERLAQYRAAVLNAAVTGELTRDWRKTNKPTETGAQLLKRLLLERRTHWEEIELKRLRATKKTPKNDKWKARYSEPSLVNTDNLPEVPKHWTWASLEMISTIGSGITVSKNRVVENPIEVPYLRVANVLRGSLDLTEIKKIYVDRDRLDSFLLKTGDILFNEGGDRDKLGRGWIWEGQLSKCVHQNHVFRARLVNQSLIDARLVSYWGNTFGQQFFMRHGKQTTNLASINRSVLAGLPIPIVPIAEQKIIIHEITNRLTAVDRLSTKLDRQLACVRAMRQTLLCKAFAGNLIPQDQKDEPASVLLSRIHAIREAEANKPKGKRMTKAKMKPIRRPLLDVLCEHKKPMTPEQLFREAGFQPSQADLFYRELLSLRKNLREMRPISSELKDWPFRSHVTLNLKRIKS